MKRSLTKGFTLIELAVAMVLAVLTALAVVSSVSMALDAAANMRVRQLETNAGLAIASLIKADLKQVALNGEIGAVGATDFIKGKIGTDTAGSDIPVCYTMPAGRLLRSYGTCMAGEDVTPHVPDGMTITISCSNPCSLMRDADGVDVAVSGDPAVTYAIVGLQVDIDANDRLSKQFDTDDDVYTIPEVVFPVAANSLVNPTTTYDTDVDDDAAAYVHPDDI
ncbi:MAG: hypothetical protein U0003_04360 [Vampirovibrionales bacterium]